MLNTFPRNKTTSNWSLMTSTHSFEIFFFLQNGAQINSIALTFLRFGGFLQIRQMVGIMISLFSAQNVFKLGEEECTVM